MNKNKNSGICGGTEFPTLVKAFSEAESNKKRLRKHRGVLNAGSASELKEGKCKIIEGQNLSIGIYKVQEKFYAVQNYCPHMGAPLCKGRLGSTYRPSTSSLPLFQEALKNRVLCCPWHGWEFDIVTGKNLSGTKARIRTFETQLNSQNEIEVLI